MYQTQGSVTNAMAVLVQVAMLYNLIILPLRFVYKLPVYTWAHYADYCTDRILVCMNDTLSVGVCVPLRFIYQRPVNTCCY
jgi:hypothetical protein